MSKLYAWYQTLIVPFKALLVFAVTILSVCLIFLVAAWQINSKAREVMVPYEQSDKMIRQHIASLKKPPALPDKYFTVLKMQQSVMNTRKTHYLDLAFLFFRNYYGVVVVTMLLSCVGGIVLFIMINKGWKNSGITLQAFFLSLFVALTFCGFFPLVFKQQENFNSNMRSYMIFTKAELSIVQQLSNFENPHYADRTDTIENKPVVVTDSVKLYKNLDSLVTVNTKVINDLTDYVLNMDAKEIKSMADIARLIGAAANGLGDSTKKK